MPTVPDLARSRPAIVASAVVAVLVVAVLAWSVFGDSPFSDDEVERAEERTSGPAETSEDELGDTSTSDTTTGDTTTGDATTTTASTSPPEDDERPTGQNPAIALEPVVDLSEPSAMADPPGPGPVLITTLEGRVHAVDLETGATEVVLDLSHLVSVGGERGLLGLAIDPEGDRLYVNYTDTGGDTDIRSWPLSDGRPEGGPDDGVVHLELGQPFANHNGGHLAFGPDGMLWIGTGDGGSAGDPGEVAQDPSRLLGKMLRVVPDPAGGVTAPSSNPDWGGRPEVWAIGLRNPWRYTFDRATDRLWIADVGQNSTEEVSVVALDEPRPNFGWDEVEGDQAYEGGPDPAFVPPVVTYRHGPGCSITGGYVYRGTRIDSLHGWYLFGDYCGGFIHAVPADAPEQPPVELVPDAGPVLSFGELEDGELLVLTSAGVRRVVGA